MRFMTLSKPSIYRIARGHVDHVERQTNKTEDQRDRGNHDKGPYNADASNVGIRL
jgi:hypothetical protein